ncbi:hypothetical protein Vadar_024784 [Vaccinium darrowii]|uniref:Uncharacterized protein n=1 Tax=Vaccinium darrowii TaxID=229202 RepID=A0ACB7Z708_9ERIC|nr:hypothetical protein Vadar_024784 [Vaccinium darrowii]
MEVSSRLKSNHFLFRPFTPLPLCRKEARVLFPSHLRPSYTGLYVRSSPSCQATLGKTLQCGSDSILFRPRNYTNATCCSFNPNNGCYRLYLDSESCERKKLSRYIAVRSELTGNGTSSASYPLPGLHVVSKVRGICFYSVTAVVAIFLFVLMLVAHPFVLLLDRYRRQAHYFIARIWALATVTPLLKVDIEGFANLPAPDTPAVYVSNHQSFLDIYALLAIGRSFKFISKTSIFIFPIIGWAMFLMGVIPLRRMDSGSQLECLKRCMDLVKKGASVFFFPEGTRSKDGKLGAFKKGAFSIAAKTKVPVVPITIIGTDQGNTRLYDILKQFCSRNRVPILVWQQASFHIGVMAI